MHTLRVPWNSRCSQSLLCASVSPAVKWGQWHMSQRLLGRFNESPFAANEAARGTQLLPWKCWLWLPAQPPLPSPFSKGTEAPGLVLNQQTHFFFLPSQELSWLVHSLISLSRSWPTWPHIVGLQKYQLSISERLCSPHRDSLASYFVPLSFVSFLYLSLLHYYPLLTSARSIF